MAVEIERKFLIHQHIWQQMIPQETIHIKQAYLTNDCKCTLRVRIANEKSFITIKGKTKNISRDEFEYEIPLDDARQLFALSVSSIIEKYRHIIVIDNKKWEVDEFLGNNKGLFVAEIELTSEDESFQKPSWIGKEVTNDHRYRNSYLAKTPITEWSEMENI